MIDFVCVGGNKCGTTWLYKMIKQHPKLNVSVNKEPSYFSHHYQRGEDWYLENWNSDERPRGEFSTSYLYSDAAIRRMSEDCPHVRVIVLLRHPIERAISHARHLMRSGIFDDGKHVLADRPEVINNSRYADRIKKLENVFGSDHVFVGFFPEIENAPSDLVTRVFSFLEVDPTFEPEGLHEVVGQGFDPKFPFLDRIRINVYRILKDNGLYSFVQIIRGTGVTKLYKKVIDQSDNSYRIREELEELLQKHLRSFCNDLDELEEMSSITDKTYIRRWVSTMCNPPV
ncbi:sulfotransferase domain-containing protein [Salinibacter sp.]|uniref:sulfotransferase domain-containing protein n=1 Tax=Salinibacter sp. TaxID=2065818 RepID=UPI0021E7F69F|nr:sulfotransferase domain-containing protein [Salinibacter sp.]